MNPIQNHTNKQRHSEIHAMTDQLHTGKKKRGRFKYTQQVKAV